MPISGCFLVIPKDHTSPLILWIPMGEFISAQCLDDDFLDRSSLFRATNNRIDNPYKITRQRRGIIGGWGDDISSEANRNLLTSNLEIAIPVRRTARRNQFEMTFDVNCLSRFVIRQKDHMTV